MQNSTPTDNYGQAFVRRCMIAFLFWSVLPTVFTGTLEGATGTLEGVTETFEGVTGTLEGDTGEGVDSSKRTLATTIRLVQQRVVKIYGAGGMRNFEAYQSGILISAQGHVLTSLSYVLDTLDLTVVLDDGSKFTAQQIGSDPITELAVLKMPVVGRSLPWFDLQAATRAEVGARVLSVSNLFGIATGEEPASVLQGVVTAVVPLDARRGQYRSNYRGMVYVVDAQVNNPGSAGGVLTDWQGIPLGVLGKELRNRVTSTWLNYALPIHEVRSTVDDILAGRTSHSANLHTAQPASPMSIAALGIALVPNVLTRTPPYIDAVRRHSAAERSGLQADDLVVLVAGQPTASCLMVLETIGQHEREEPLRISVLRGGELLELELRIER
jgi:S1-C subfamily serine protease